MTESRISEKNLTTLRLELNRKCKFNRKFNRKCKSCIETLYNIRSITEWTDSTVVLHWLKTQGYYKKFVANKKVHKVVKCPNQKKIQQI